MRGKIKIYIYIYIYIYRYIYIEKRGRQTDKQRDILFQGNVESCCYFHLTLLTRNAEVEDVEGDGEEQKEEK